MYVITSDVLLNEAVICLVVSEQVVPISSLGGVNENKSVKNLMQSFSLSLSLSLSLSNLFE